MEEIVRFEGRFGLPGEITALNKKISLCRKKISKLWCFHGLTYYFGTIFFHHGVNIASLNGILNHYVEFSHSLSN